MEQEVETLAPVLNGYPYRHRVGEMGENLKRQDGHGHGDQTLFASLHTTVLQGLPREPVEWRRSYGRPPRTIHCAANFVPFNPDILPGEDDWTLLGRTFFHTYWTDCDIDTYKAVVKDDITEWLAALKVHNITDWLVVVIVNDESKVKAKLLRTSVYDKVKSDFCSKQGERCVVLTEPLRMDSRSSESWGIMLSRMRQLLLQSFNKNLSRFEEYMRAQRERRTETMWTFNQYFMLQEELAFMFEMLGLLEDALVQYDELDALFTQFLLNHAAGDSAGWLHALSEVICTTWDGLCLAQPINIDKRHLIKHNKASLLDFRNYLFSRQCTLLFLLQRPWEVAQRCVPFMHNCIQELDILELTMLPGSMACWVFLSCLEVLQTCEKFTDSGQMEAYSLYTASLWDYARNKLYVVAGVCGMVGSAPHLTPRHHHQRRHLLDGAVLERYDSDEGKSRNSALPSNGESEPLAKLREALSSKESFQKHYMELSELAMGTYKHIGRIRSARLIGRDLADFYMKLGQPEKAEGFLLDALKTYRTEGWEVLADKTQLDIAGCQKLLGNNQKYAKSCCHVAASKSLDKDIRLQHQQEMMAIAASQDDGDMILMRTKPAFNITNIAATSASFILNSKVTISTSIESNLVESVHADVIAISIMQPRLVDQCSSHSEEELNKSTSFSRSRHSSMSSVKSTELETPLSPVPTPIEFDIHPHIEMAANNKTIITTSLVSRSQPVKRTDSGPSLLREREAVKDDFDLLVEVRDITLQPGENRVTLDGVMPGAGLYTVSQLCIQVSNLEFLRHLGSNPATFSVNSEDPVITIKPLSEPLLAGLPQEFIVSLSSGSKRFDDSHTLQVMTTQGLDVNGNNMSNGLKTLPPVEPYETLDIVLTLTADLDTEPADQIYHQLTMECDWLVGNVTYPMTFKHPLNITHKLHTAGKRKYIQVVVHSSTNTEFVLSKHDLMIASPDVSLTALNKAEQTIVVSCEQSASYMWQLVNNAAAAPPLLCTFSINYATSSLPGQATEHVPGKPGICRRNFDLDNYKTLYDVKSEVTPGEKSEKCYAGALCQLQLDITKLGEAPPRETLMYEVMSDPTLWAVCGKSKGVLTLNGASHVVHLGVMPLVAGFLPIPTLKLVKYKPFPDAFGNKENQEDTPPPAPEVTSEANNPTSALPHLTPFHVGQVYNSSAASQVHVMPTSNVMHVDVIVQPV